MELIWKQTDDFLTIDGDKKIECWCEVRNELNGKRKNAQVVYSMPDKKPYMPRVFPVGKWQIQWPIPKTDPYMAPYFLPTNAYQYCDVWITDARGYYVKPSGEQVKDIGYGLHFSTSTTTLGCIRIAKQDDLLYLVDKVNEALSKKEPCRLIVTA